MRVILLLSLLIIGIRGNATDYYVSANGNDANNGTSSSSPWRSLNKLNSAFSSFKPGDNVYLNRGDVFYGSINVTQSGSSGSPITISAYGSGNKPVVTGFTTVSSWTNLGGNIWESSNAVSTLPYTNMVAVNGVNTAMGRYPNNTLFSVQSYSGTSVTTGDNVGGINWTGAELALYRTTYTIARNKITSLSGNTVSYEYNAKDIGIQFDPGWFTPKFFIQNDPRTLDLQNEWYYNPISKKLRIYSLGSPSNVQLPSIEKLINIEGDWKGIENILIDNISFTGSNTASIAVVNSRYISIQNCDFNFSGTDAIFGPWSGNSSYLKVENCSISNSNNTAIDLSGNFGNAVIKNNSIKNSGSIAGMGTIGGDIGNGSYGAILVAGANTSIQYNNIDNTGYSGIRFSGTNSNISNNYINNFCTVLIDGGGIYTNYIVGSSNNNSTTISNNIVLNGYTDPGIYLDEKSNGINVSGNTVANCNWGIYLHNVWNINVLNNVTFNNGYINNYNNNGTGFMFDNYDPQVNTSNINVKNNIFFSKTAKQNSAVFSLIKGIFPTSFISENNYFVRPIDDNNTVLGILDHTYNYLSLLNWSKISGKDLNSKKSPKTITDVNDLRFEFNATTSNKTVNLDANYIDVTGRSFNGTITLSPYTSAVLIKNGPSTNQQPIADAGKDQVITLPISAVNLTGKGSDPDGTISSYSWSKILGPSSGTITNLSSISTSVTELVQGDYLFQLQVTDNIGAIGLDTVKVTVNAGNYIPPSITAGSDQSITLPTNSISLQGSGIGGITAYNWTKISGPSAGNITNVNSASTTVTGLVQGTYQFQLQVTDTKGAVTSAVVNVVVNADGQLLPAINPGSVINGLDYKYYEGAAYSVVPNFNSIVPAKTGSVAGFDISQAGKAEIFSFNFTGYINIPTDGHYTFYSTSDDGTLLYIDGVLVVNNDGLHGASEISGTIGLKAGYHKISVGYFQQTGFKVLSISYQGPNISKQIIPTSYLFRNSTDNLLPAINPGTVLNGLDYRYYEASSYSSVPNFALITPVKSGSDVNFDITSASKGEGFSFNFSGYINVPSDGQYTFYATSDDGSMLYIDGKLVVNNDGLHWPEEQSGTIGLKSGLHAISVGYFQQGGNKILSISYAGPTFSKQKVPSSALYRLSDGGLLPAVNVSNPVNGLEYKYFENSSFDKLPDFSTIPVVKSGSSSAFDISSANKLKAFAFNFSGYVNIPQDGQYTFYTTSDDGSKLFIDGLPVVDNDGLHWPVEKSGSIGLKAGFHAVQVGYFQQSGNLILNVSYSGTDIQKQAIPASMLFRSGTSSSSSRTMNSNSRNSIITTQATDSTKNQVDLVNTPGIKAYPNPFVNSIEVNITGNAGDYKLILVDVSGKILWTKKGTKTVGIYCESISTSSLQRGVYFLRVIQNNKNSVFKLEK